MYTDTLERKSALKTEEQSERNTLKTEVELMMYTRSTRSWYDDGSGASCGGDAGGVCESEVGRSQGYAQDAGSVSFVWDGVALQGQLRRVAWCAAGEVVARVVTAKESAGAVSQCWPCHLDEESDSCRSQTPQIHVADVAYSDEPPSVGSFSAGM